MTNQPTTTEINTSLHKILKEKLRFGIEIESITSKQIDMAEYHANYEDSGECDCDEDCTCDEEGESQRIMYGDYFYAEEDGSLDRMVRTSRKYRPLVGDLPFGRLHSGECEFITLEPFKYEDIDKILTNFEASLNREGVKLFFNQSCGAHVHCSLPDIQLPDIMDVNRIFAFRRKLFTGMRQFFNDEQKFKIWASYYFRTYAKKTTRKNASGHDRYSEINKTLGSRIEVRSTHLMGIKNFDEMKRVYKIFFDAIIYALSYKTVNKQNDITFVRRIPLSYKNKESNISLTVSDKERHLSYYVDASHQFSSISYNAFEPKSKWDDISPYEELVRELEREMPDYRIRFRTGGD